MLESFFALSIPDLIGLFLAGTIGLVAHYLMKIVELRKVSHGLTWRSYYVEHAPETLLSIITAYAGIIGLIEFGQATLLNAFLLSHFVDSSANKFRSRATGLLT